METMKLMRFLMMSASDCKGAAQMMPEGQAKDELIQQAAAIRQAANMIYESADGSHEMVCLCELLCPGHSEEYAKKNGPRKIIGEACEAIKKLLNQVRILEAVIRQQENK